MTRTYLEHPERLQALRETDLLDALPQDSLDRYTRIASLAIGVPVSLVSLVDDRRQFFSSLVGLPEPWASRRESPLTHSFCKLVVESGEELVVADAPRDVRVARNPAVTELGVVAYAGKPIRTWDAHVLGSFCVLDNRPREWTSAELSLLDEICAAVTAEIELRRRAHRHARSEQDLAALNAEMRGAIDASALEHAQTAHDIRNPLSVITLGVEMVLAHAAVRALPEMEETLESVARSAEHLTTLVTGLVETDGVVERTTKCDLMRVAAEVAKDMRRIDRRIECNVASTPANVSLGATSARRCIENMLFNALRFAVNQIRLSVSVSANQALLTVEDDGPGLPNADAYANVWNRGVRYHVESGRSRTGLGLSIVKKMVEHAGGRVRASTSPLGGASFSIALPLVISEPAARG